MHITNSWSEASGGIATFYRALIEAANRRGQAISLVVPGPVDCDKTISEFVRIYQIAAPESKLNSAYRTIYPNQYMTRAGKLRKILSREKPDLLEINDKYTLNYLGPLLRLRLMTDIDFRPVVVGLSCERMDVNFRTYVSAGILGRAFCAWYMRNIYFPFFDHHIAISDQTAHELRSACKGHVITRGIFQLHLGVDCRIFSPRHRSASERSQLLRRIAAPDKAVLLLYAGRLAPEKNVSLLIETLEQLFPDGRDYRLIVAGDGISRKLFLADAQKRLNKRITWLGHITNREELAKLYANCDFFLHPNPQEPFGIAPLEAMASGVLLVAPDSGGLKAYANSSNAGLTHATGPAFASMIRNLIESEDRRRKMASSALQTAQEFSFEAITDRYLNLYKKLVAISRNELPIEAAAPAFLSQPPSPLRAAVMRWAAVSASSVYSVLADARGRVEKNKKSGNPEGRKIVDSI
jgi:alpha-1,6-mannosyltransferase